MAYKDAQNIYLRRTNPMILEERKLNASPITARDKDIIREHQVYLASKKSGPARIAKVSWQLRVICSTLHNDLGILKDIDSLNRDDIIKLVATINFKESYSEATKADYRRIIKSFFKYFRKRDQRLKVDDKNIREEANEFYDYVENELKKAEKVKQINPSDVLTEEDIQQLLESTDNILHRAVIAVLYDTGTRIGEFLGIKLKDIEFKNNHAIISVDGKTGRRTIPILKSVPHLSRWIEEHPLKNDSNAYLWTSKSNRYKNRSLNYAGIKKIINNAFNRTNINKPRNCHWFRHSKASSLEIDGYNDEIKRKYMGWKPGSKMTEVYVHIGGGHVDTAFMEKNGLIETRIDKPKIIFCGCGQINEPKSRYCIRCGKPLSLKIMLDDDERKKDAINEAFELLTKIMSDPSLRAKFEAFKQKNMEE